MTSSFLPYNTLYAAPTYTVDASVHVAQYHIERGIVLHPDTVNLPYPTLLFVLYHEEAHGELRHLYRRAGEGQKSLEYEADVYALDKVRALGYDTCSAVEPILYTRGVWSFTHPNRFTLSNLACGESK